MRHWIRMTKRVAWLAMVAMGSAPAAVAQTPAGDWPQWRGPNRDGISAETGWSARWPEGGPKVLWTSEKLGSGYSTVSVVDGRVYTMGNDGKQDTIWCLDADTGKEVWRHAYPCKKGGYPGPRATPTVHDARVYTVSREGDVACLDAKTGKVFWSKDLAKEVNADVPGWGVAGSPLILGDLVVYNINAGVALRKDTGAIAWKTPRAKNGYSTPVPFKDGDRQCLLIFAAKGLVCVDAGTGARIWEVPWKTAYDVNAADPIVVGDRIFICSGYGKGCAMIRAAGGKAEVLWTRKTMGSQFSTPVLHQGHLYGGDGNVGKARVQCIDFDTGQEKWSSGRMGMVSLMMADGKLIIRGDKGVLAIAEATPEAYKQIAFAKVLGGMCWTMPVLADGKIYVRNNRRGELACLDVSGK